MIEYEIYSNTTLTHFSLDHFCFFFQIVLPQYAMFLNIGLATVTVTISKILKHAILIGTMKELVIAAVGMECIANTVIAQTVFNIVLDSAAE